MRAIFLGLAVLFVASAAHALQDGTAERDQKALQGTWNVTGLEVQGKQVPKAPTKLTFKGDVMTGLGPPMTLRLDPSKKPKHMDLTFESPKKEKKTFPAIYSVEGDTLRIAFPVVQAGKKVELTRPESFETKDSLIALITAKREKDKPNE
jgi:uncharacterized protein (TIGR03067 family)